MENKSKKISVSQVIVFVICFAVAYFVAAYFLSKDEKSPNVMLIENARVANKSMPKMLDSITRLDSISVDETILKYHHTLINIEKNNSDMDFDLIKSTMTKKSQDNLDTNPIMKEYRENNVYLQYIFNDKNQKEVFEYTVRHQD
jgi:hypothetical protein